MLLMNNQPLVSVIISVFNDEKNIKKAVNSILNQSYENFEICILDDGSTDNTFSICQELNNQNSKIILLRNHQNQGLTKSLNTLIENSKGYYIARQDSDDVSHRNRLAEQVKFLNKFKLQICTTRARRIDSGKKIPGISFYIPTKFLIKYKNPFIHGTLLAKKELLVNVGKYDEKYRYAQDYFLFAKLNKLNVKIGKINKVLYDLNMENNISTKFKKEQKYFSKLVKKYIKENEV